MCPEYDFRKAVRGKHNEPLHEGYDVHIRKSDGTTVTEHFEPTEDTVMLRLGILRYFPDSESFNAVLRSLTDVGNVRQGQSSFAKKRSA